MYFKAKIKNINGNLQVVLTNQQNANLGLVKFKDCEVMVDVNQLDGTRTEKQNKSFHLYFSMLAKELNDAGFDMKKTLREEVDIPWTMDLVKNNLWRPVQLAYLDKKSTKRLNKMEITVVYDIVNRAISERTGVCVEFPKEEDQY